VVDFGGADAVERDAEFANLDQMTSASLDAPHS
jgi:hypothetical protein